MCVLLRLKNKLHHLKNNLLLSHYFCGVKFRNMRLPDGPVVKTLSFHYRGHRFDPWLAN